MFEFARRNAGVVAAAGAYGLLGTAGVLAMQQAGNGVSPPPISAPPGATSSPSTPPSEVPPGSPRATSPTPRPSPEQSGSLAIAARSSSAGGDWSGAFGGGSAGSGSGGAPSQPPHSSYCGAGRVVAVTVPLGALPCDTVRVGRLAQAGGTR